MLVAAAAMLFRCRRAIAITMRFHLPLIDATLTLTRRCFYFATLIRLRYAAACRLRRVSMLPLLLMLPGRAAYAMLYAAAA